MVAITLVGAGLWYLRSLPKPVAIAASSPAAGANGSGSGAAAAGASPTGPPIIVDVTGWVREPGVYEFAQGDRVIDAVERAGGARPNADLSGLNLAAPLTDGTQVVVLKSGGGAGRHDGLHRRYDHRRRPEHQHGERGRLRVALGNRGGPGRRDRRLPNRERAVRLRRRPRGRQRIGPATLEEIRDQITV